MAAHRPQGGRHSSRTDEAEELGSGEGEEVEEDAEAEKYGVQVEQNELNLPVGHRAQPLYCVISELGHHQ